MSEQGVDDFTSPGVGVQFGFPLRGHHWCEMGGGRILLRDRCEKLLVLLGDHVTAGEGFADRERIAVRIGHRFVAAEAEHSEDLLDESWIIRREDSKGITHFVRQTGPGEVDLEVTCILGGARACEGAVGAQLGRKWILAGIEGSGISGHSV